MCKCDCGRSDNFITSAKNLKSGATTSCGCRSESLVAFELKKYFLKNYDAEDEHQIIINPDTGYWLRCDICVHKNIYIEINGIQHYCLCGWHYRSAKRNGTTPQQELEYQQWKDDLKKQYAEKNGLYIEIDLRKIKTTSKAIEYIENILNQFQNGL